MFKELLPVLRDRAVLLTVTLVDTDQIRVQAIKIDRMLAVDTAVGRPEHNLAGLRVDQPTVLVVMLVFKRRSDLSQIDSSQVERSTEVPGSTVRHFLLTFLQLGLLDRVEVHGNIFPLKGPRNPGEFDQATTRRRQTAKEMTSAANIDQLFFTPMTSNIKLRKRL